MESTMMMNPMMSAECCNPMMSMMSHEFSSKNMPSWFNPMTAPMSGSHMMPSTMPSMPFSWPSMPSTMPSMMPFSWPSMPSAMPSTWNPMMWSNWMSPVNTMSGWKNEAEMRNMPVRPSNWMECWSMSEPIKMDNFGNRMFKLNLDMHLYKPEEIKVSFKAAEKKVVVEAACEEKFDPKAASPMSESSILSASKGCTKRTYYREFVLPEECKIENLKCNLSFNGWLNFECVMPHISSSPVTAASMMMSSVPSAFPHMPSCPSIFNKAHYGKAHMDSVPINVNYKN